ncbi:MAG TPA: hypothetical protein VGP84_05460 [Gemmatimonadaceae bacterium]|jgi:hypothetical protein|nr:hypothetical protein [Gemmatimonadaceae bacterium]
MIGGILHSHRRWVRLALGAAVLVAPLIMALWFSSCPQYGDPTCPSKENPLAAMAAFRSAAPLWLHVFLVLTLLVPFVYPLSYVGLGAAAFRRAPTLASVGVAAGWLGSVSWGFISDIMLQLNTAMQTRRDAGYAALQLHYITDLRVLTIGGFWVIGHLFGYILLGVALLRARVGPRWASWLMIASAVLMGPIAYGSNIGSLQILGFLGVFVASVPAARVLIS